MLEDLVVDSADRRTDNGAGKVSEKWEGARLVFGDAPGQVGEAYALGQLEIAWGDLLKQVPVRLQAIRRVEERARVSGRRAGTAGTAGARTWACSTALTANLHGETSSCDLHATLLTSPTHCFSICRVRGYVSRTFDVQLPKPRATHTSTRFCALLGSNCWVCAMSPGVKRS